MPGRTTSLILLATVLAGVPATAQETGRSELEESLGRPRRVPPVPAELRRLFRDITRDRLVIRDLNGGDVAIDITEYEPDEFQQFADGRFVGFAFMGYEFYGYQLIDRAMAGDAAVIETGATPVFSPDGRHFAAVQLSGAGFGNLEGVAIWRVEADRTRQILFSGILPEGEEWRVEGWPRPNCVAISYAVRDSEGRTDSQPRRHLAIGLGTPIRLSLRGDQPGCNGEPSGEDDDG